MKGRLALTACLAWVGVASAFQPRTGNWWNPAETGRDFNIEIQNGNMVLVVYAYQPSGPAQWYLASGPMTNAGHSFTGTLDKYVGGQCISCSFSGPPAPVGNDGVIAIIFSSETAATVTLPGGRTTSIQPFNFSGDPPQGLLGEWLFVYDSASTFAVKYALTTVVSPTSNGNGVVGGSIVGAPSQLAVCELQTSGLLAGLVVCGDADAAGNLKNAYYFRFGVDETYGGYHLSAGSQTQNPMKGYKTKSRSEVTASGLPTGALATPPTALSADPKPEPEASIANADPPLGAVLERGQAVIDAARGVSKLR